MSSNVIAEIGKNVETAGKRMKSGRKSRGKSIAKPETAGKRMKSGRKSRGKSIAKPPDYADRRELKSLSYLGI